MTEPVVIPYHTWSLRRQICLADAAACRDASLRPWMRAPLQAHSQPKHTLLCTQLSGKPVKPPSRGGFMGKLQLNMCIAIPQQACSLRNTPKSLMKRQSGLPLSHSYCMQAMCSNPVWPEGATNLVFHSRAGQATSRLQTMPTPQLGCSVCVLCRPAEDEPCLYTGWCWPLKASPQNALLHPSGSLYGSQLHRRDCESIYPPLHACIMHLASAQATCALACSAAGKAS